MKEERNLNLRLPVELHEQLRERAEEEDRSIAQVIRVAARRYLATPNPVTAQLTVAAVVAGDGRLDV